MVAPRPTTRTDYANPYRPRPISVLNALGRFSRSIGLLKEINVNKLLRNARQSTGLTDFGDSWFLEPLHCLVDSMNREAKLTPIGQFIQSVRLERALTTRLRVQDQLKRNRAIHDVDIGNVIVIAALQRTGTTKLQRMIASHPDIQGLVAWEALNPVMFPGEHGGRPAKRIRQAQLANNAIEYLSPDFNAVHPIDFNAPEEDVLLLDLCFMSQSAEATMHVPAYANWLEHQNHAKAYDYFHTVLKLLHLQHPSTGWVLKSPHHMEYLECVLATFPQVTIVATHRDPLKTIPSFCSMVAHGRGIFSDDVDPQTISKHWLRKVDRMVRHTQQVRATADPHKFVDVLYADFMNSPLEQLRKVFQCAGVDFDAQAERIAGEELKSNYKGRYGTHAYDLNSFGLTEETIHANFRSYQELYNIPTESVEL